MGRLPKGVAPSNCPVLVRVRPDQHAWCQAAADRAGQTLTDFARQAMLERAGWQDGKKKRGVRP